MHVYEFIQIDVDFERVGARTMTKCRLLVRCHNQKRIFLSHLAGPFSIRGSSWMLSNSIQYQSRFLGGKGEGNKDPTAMRRQHFDVGIGMQSLDHNVILENFQNY